MAARRLGRFLTFRTKGALYLPPLIDEADDVVFNEIRFNHSATLENVQIPTVQRVHSMSLIGWRAFAALLRLVITRTGDEEVGFRRAVAERLSLTEATIRTRSPRLVAHRQSRPWARSR